LQAAEMALLRLIHASELPDPADLVKRLLEDGVPGAAPALPAMAGAPPAAAPAASIAAPTASPAAAPAAATPPASDAMPADFTALVALFRQHNEPRLWHMLTDELRLVSLVPPRLALASGGRVARDQIARIGECLAEWTGAAWQIELVAEGGAPTLREAQLAADAARLATARADPVVAAVFNAFPGAEIIGVDASERISHAQSR
jgi:DNA polymerase-3 subunit gamma/tau